MKNLDLKMHLSPTNTNTHVKKWTYKYNFNYKNEVLQLYDYLNVV